MHESSGAKSADLNELGSRLQAFGQSRIWWKMLYLFICYYVIRLRIRHRSEEALYLLKTWSLVRRTVPAGLHKLREGCWTFRWNCRA
jgi:hypothetical protein